MDDQATPPPTWKVVIAAILDFLLVFIIGGYIIAKLTGNATEEGFNLQGGPALALFALIVVYFIAGNKYFGGTLFKHVLGTTRKP